MTIKDFYADRIIDFIKKYAPYVIEFAKKQSNTPVQFLKEIIKKHMEYNTIVVIWNKGEIVSVCAFNIDGTKADIVDCIVHPDYRCQGLLKKMTLIALERYPYLTEIKFERPLKDRGVNPKTISISRLLKIPTLV